tara:strand:+ start:4876 stop:6579 length:1704 start_codon:yes stop_codon:yes gene_type:complete
MFKVSLIGHGRWGNKIVKAIKDFVQIVDNDSAEWIIISTPNDLHYEQVKYWLNSGKNVFCEKPLTLSLESSIKLFDLANKKKLKLYVDDVFFWRKDLKKNPTSFIWSKFNNINFIDRLAYHHFYLWLQNKNEIVNIEKVTVINNSKFEVLLSDGLKGSFDYNNKLITHRIDSNEVKATKQNPLQSMLISVFNQTVDFNSNKIRTLNATKVSEIIRKKMYPKALVVGGGIFGSSAAIALSNNGYNVELHEELSDIMNCASNINQYRLHRGYHYPRSKATALECKNGIKSFKRKYEQCVIKNNNDHYYSISSKNSLTKPNQFIDFMNSVNLNFKEKKIKEIKNVDYTVKVEEELFDNSSLYNLVVDKLFSNSIDVKLNKRSSKKDFKKFDVIVIATYSRLNDLIEDKKEYQFEVVEKPVVKLPLKYQNKSIVIMDGPFMCLDPYGNNGQYHVLGNVVHAIHETNIGEKPIISKKLKSYLNHGIIKNPEITKINKFIEHGNEYFKDFDKLKHIGSMFTVRTVLKGREYDDARPTLVRFEGNKIFSLFSGKIDTCVDAANELVEKIKNYKY